MAQFQIFSYFYDVIYCLWHHNHWFCLEHLASKFSRNNVFYGYYVNNTQGSGQTWQVWNICVFDKMGIFCFHFYILALKFPNKGCICLDIILQRSCIIFQKIWWNNSRFRNFEVGTWTMTSNISLCMNQSVLFCLQIR